MTIIVDTMMSPKRNIQTTRAAKLEAGWSKSMKILSRVVYIGGSLKNARSPASILRSIAALSAALLGRRGEEDRAAIMSTAQVF
jgi:hypothetical protein